MIVARTKVELRSALRARSGGTVGFVPTMGFLHEGHMSLMREARRRDDLVVASIFVNPTQFAPGEDLDHYPRDAAGDTQKCRECGVDVLWMPSTDSVYEPDHTTTVHVAGLTNGLCADSRPTHFDGVTTVVAKLFLLVRPDRAYFGQKDYQQLAVVRRMVRDLDFGIDVVSMPIVREPDGLAMSSRNAYLDAAGRARGLALSGALRAAGDAYRSGERDVDSLVAILETSLEGVAGLRVDYAQIVDPTNLVDLSGTTLSGDAVAAVAAFVGNTRLIDNTLLSEPVPASA